MKKIVSWAIALFIFFLFPLKVNATSVPSFPSCPNPGGSVLASFDSGTHGIPGSANSYSGSDAVYQTGDNAVVQCFCGAGDNSIQTNWWKFSDLTADQIDSYKAQGWIFIPDGSAWGLEATSYLAKNIFGSCGIVTTAGGGGTGGGGGGGGNPSAPTCSDEAPKSAPILLSARPAGPNAVELIWTQAADPVTYYLIAYGTQPGVYLYGNPNVGPRGTTTFTVNHLSGGQVYYFVVRAGNGCKPGPFSHELSSRATGTYLSGLALGFSPDVLSEEASQSADTEETTPIDESQLQGCTECKWVPILAGMAGALAAYYFLMRGRPWTNWRWVIGAGIALVAYIVFLLWNIDCPNGVIDLKLFKLPCRWFWAVDGISFPSIAWLFKKYLTKPQV